MHNPADELTFQSALTRAAQGLLYPSESDAPFEAFQWKAGGSDPRAAIAAQGKRADEVSEISIDAFFAQLIAGDQGPEFARLKNVLQSQLNDLRVLRVGQIEIDIYLIGKTSAGDWAGLHTVSIET